MDIKGMKVLSIDDNKNNLLMIEVHGKALGVEVFSYSDPVAAYNEVKRNNYDMIIVDYMMPEMDGLTFIRKYREIDNDTPVIMITAVGDDDEIHYKALQFGATDFLKKPMNGTLFKLRVKNLLELKQAQLLIKDRARLLETEVEKATAGIKASELETLSVVGKTAEYKDPETGDHIKRVSNYALILAKAWGLNQSLQDILYHSAPLHDIGKVGIPDDILTKPGPLDKEQWDIMQTHPLIGYEILKKAKSKYLNAGSIIAFTHHEKYDGTGYPKGLKGESIPILGRIVALSDVFDALTSKRPYKEAWAFDEAVRTIKEESGKHFDPKLVNLFLENICLIKEVYIENKADINNKAYLENKVYIDK